ncbi:MAG: hypothetical protein ABGX20_12920 [Bacillus sp. (in: firmicutes)]
MINQNTSNSSFPIINPDFSSEVNSKLNEDRYEVFVNNHFVGQKALKSQGENLSDIDEFLRNQGYSSFSSSINGDHYIISVNEDISEIENALSVYFNNR